MPVGLVGAVCVIKKKKRGRDGKHIKEAERRSDIYNNLINF